jgi:hypothetical protein
MPEIDLKRLRDLRHRAEGLLATLTSDLAPFRHEKPFNGFRRKPDSESPPDDVNVTTTCSCLMSLALAGKLTQFYGADGRKTAKETFKALLSAPWMSSGLAENNAFTTTLMIRLFGLLVDSEVLNGEAGAPEFVKLWEPRIAISKGKFSALASKLVSQKHPLARLLFELLPWSLQKVLEKLVRSTTYCEKTEGRVVAAFEQLIRTANFCRPEYLADLPKGTEISERLARATGEYLIPELNRQILHDFFSDEVEALQSLSLEAIAQSMSAKIDRFRINDYEPSAAVVYWFVDGVARAKIILDSKHWDGLCEFAVDEFGKQRSRAVANDAALMDPVAMAMAACLCARLRNISKALLYGTNNSHHSKLPSTTELESAIVDLFGAQTPSGIWPKYFPLFHYQDAGSNFCYTFELLEAVLYEFGGKDNRLLAEEAVIFGLERALQSCDVNRLQTTEGDYRKTVLYSGWNSGGNLQTLRRGQPESWATAVVHMFLWELVEVLSRRIQSRLLEKYVALKPPLDASGIGDLLDIEVLLPEGPTSLKGTLQSNIIKTFESFRGGTAERLRKTRVKGRLSALLFGPPGTSKTEVAKAVAAELKWPLVEIDPSHFLQSSFQNIYVQAEKIFEDTMDMCGVVVLFDEMDALVQKRDGDHVPDTEAKFLTTYMLPKLAKLHDRAQIVFLMATNFQATFDDAIKRAGRFDLLLCMGPPILKDKCNAIHRFLGCIATEETKKAGEVILTLASKEAWVEDQLTLYTFGEFKSFARRVCPIDSLADAVRTLEGYSPEQFRHLVENDSQTVGLRLSDLGSLFDAAKITDKRLRKLDEAVLNESLLKKDGVDLNNPAVKYMLEKHQTKLQ